MNFPEIKSAIKHLQKNCPCMGCNTKYRQIDIHVLASTQHEGLFELKCNKCNKITVVTVFLEKRAPISETYNPEYKSVNKISENDVLDVKNFLNQFDGNFKKAFKKKDAA